MIEHEILRHIKTNKITNQNMATKIDMNKAYDRVEWLYLNRMLEKKRI